MWRPQRLATALLVGLAAVVASVRYFYKCVTCPDVVLPVLQVDLTLAGVVLFTAASFLILHSRATLVPHLLSFAVAYQLYLLFELGADCSLCLAILALITLATTAESMKPLDSDPVRMRKWAHRSLCGAATATVALLFLAGQHTGQQLAATPQVAPKINAEALVGQHWDLLQVEGLVPEQGPFLLVIGSSECAPCRLAYRWAATDLNLPTHAVEPFADRSGESVARSRAWLSETSPITASPTLALIGSSGRILAIEQGWAENAAVKESLKKTMFSLVSTDVETAKQQGEDR